ncbi:MAG: glutamine-hydrolyzing GMP synthase [Bacteroidetes bacterium]|nr:glutamine-hydrolyzing GMP synthase [Bacteroidota bacterium]
MHQKILVLDFGSQLTQLIARRLRELRVYCEIHPYNKIPQLDETIRGIILSGSPASVHDNAAPQIDINNLSSKYPILGICYGAQLIANNNGGVVSKTSNKEYGRAILEANTGCELFAGISQTSQVWMSHGDTITSLPETFETVANTDSIPIAGFRIRGKNIFGIQFHPEVTHSIEGKKILKNFVYNICGCNGDWTPANFVEETIEQIKQTVGNDKVILGLSGGVDSSVAAALISKAIGKNLYCIFINHGLLRKNEFQEVLQAYQSLDLNVKGVDASEIFYEQLNGISDPEQKRKIIGRVFVEMFDKEAAQVEGARWLAQGTIYPDVIESVSVNGPSATIKSHHNVGGLPEKMNLKILEPLRSLFKDEVRNVGAEIGLPNEIIGRHPFPGPGLAIRILGEITREKIKTLQEADSIYINELKAAGWYDKIWQAGAIFLPVQSVGVMGDERTYENAVCLRAVMSRDGMTADWVHIPYELLAVISNKIINNVKGINRVVYDISSKPPATIEWE